MGLLSSITGPINNFVGDITGANALQAAGSNAADMARFKPFNITTGFGTGTFNGTNATSVLSPQYQALRDSMLGGASGYFNSALNFDPNAYAANAYGLMRNISQPYEDQQRASLESRLYNQGNLGSTGGYWASRAFEDSMNTNKQQQQLQSIDLGQNLLNNQIQRGQTFLTGAQGLDQAGSGLIQQGLLGGYFASPANSAAARMQFSGDTGAAQANAAFWNGLINAGANYMTGGMSGMSGGGMGMQSYFGNMFGGNNVPGWGSASASYT